MASQLDPTLSQVLSELFDVSRERDQFKAILTQMNEKLDDQDYLLGRLNEVRVQTGLPVVTVPGADETEGGGGAEASKNSQLWPASIGLGAAL
jgi:hypothetical protein